MLQPIDFFNLFICVLFMLLYCYQAPYFILSMFKKSPRLTCKKLHKFAVLVAARNESAVIGELIKSIQKQNYPSELVDIYIIADNCTDNTADIARELGAYVIVRNNKQFVGKGYALQYALNRIENKYDGYFVFDADNLLDENFIREMNGVFGNGYKVVTSYRNSKNFDSSWVSAGYSLSFIREARFVNNARMILGTSCAISGTGFLVHRDIIEKNCGWKHLLLTEDIEFTVDSVIQGEKIGYCPTAVIYDEQPITFKQSYIQRLRWSKGFYQVFANYGGSLFKSILRNKDFSCFDMFVTVAPASILSVLATIVNLIALAVELHSPVINLHVLESATQASYMGFVSYFLMLFAYGALTTIFEWDNINCKKSKKIISMFTFPFFMFTHIPISIIALFKRIGWAPIQHSISKSVEDIKKAV